MAEKSESSGFFDNDLDPNWLSHGVPYYGKLKPLEGWSFFRHRSKECLVIGRVLETDKVERYGHTHIREITLAEAGDWEMSYYRVDAENAIAYPFSNFYVLKAHLDRDWERV